MTIKEKMIKFQEEFNPLFLSEVEKLLLEQKNFHPTHFDQIIDKAKVLMKQKHLLRN